MMFPRRQVLPGRCRAPMALLAALLLAGGCSFHYNQGLALEAQNRWEEAAIEYHLAVIEDPGDAEIRAALERADKVVARDNFDRYRQYLAQKEFRKAYERLQDSARQDPDFAPSRDELKKWQRVLVGGQMLFQFHSLNANLSVADEINLVVRLNTPNPGEVLEANVDIGSGNFLVQNLLYDPPLELQTYYTLNSIGVSLLHGRTETKQFTNREFLRFINFRTPVLDSIQGALSTEVGNVVQSVVEQRSRIADAEAAAPVRTPRSNPHYSMRLDGFRIHVQTNDAGGVFTPRYLYLNRQSRRLLVDFGRYRVRQLELAEQWEIERLPIRAHDYFPEISKIIALQPYFFYREGVYTYVDGDAGS